MRLMTYNIWDGGAARAALIAEVIALADPDVVLLNEADDERVVESLARQLSVQHVWARGSGDKHIALLTRLPIVEWRVYNRRPITQAVLYAKLQLPNSKSQTSTPNSQLPTPNLQSPTPSDDPPRALGGGGRTVSYLQLFGVHLMPYFMLLPFEVARWRTMRALLRLVQQTARGPHLICGDFNAALRGERAATSVFSKKIQRQLWLQANWQPRFALSQILRAGYTDCFRQLHPHDAGRTWMPWAPSARLDYIFAETEMARRLRRCDVITAPPAMKASDHFPLVAEFEV